MPIQPIHRGKVRDTYDLSSVYPRTLLQVATDRISVFDVVLPNEIPGKGAVLTELTKFWLGRIPRGLVYTHLVPRQFFRDLNEDFRSIPNLDECGLIVEQGDMLPIECIVRNYLYGSVVKEYERQRTVCGIQLPGGLIKASQLPEPVFTPSTKAEVGHDVNIDITSARKALEVKGFDPNLVDEVERISLAIFEEAAAYALERGIILADTKFEFGLQDGDLMLCDEVLTPDSSRFWDASTWEPGQEPTSFDKQPVRDFYANEHPEWGKTYPAPPLPDHVIEATQERYQAIKDILLAA